MHGYYFSVGYNSGYSLKNNFDTDKFDKILEQEARRLMENPMRIAGQAINWDEHDLKLGRNKTMTISRGFFTDENVTFGMIKEDTSQFFVSIICTGYNVKYKESLCRAFSRLLLRGMHKHQIEINVEVI